jgi:hypothetical protein
MKMVFGQTCKWSSYHWLLEYGLTRGGLLTIKAATPNMTPIIPNCSIISLVVPIALPTFLWPPSCCLSHWPCSLPSSPCKWPCCHLHSFHFTDIAKLDLALDQTKNLLGFARFRSLWGWLLLTTLIMMYMQQTMSILWGSYIEYDVVDSKYKSIHYNHIDAPPCLTIIVYSRCKFCDHDFFEVKFGNMW